MKKPIILFGPAGTGSPASEGLKQIHKLGLNCAEVEFTYGVNMKNEYAAEVGKVASELGISLSVHCPYYINLASEDLEKRKASQKRILDSCERAHFLRAKYIVFHPAFYGKLNSEECYKIVKEAIILMQEEIIKNKWNVVLCPETTGKKTAFGTLEELYSLSKESGCGVCVDFAHLEARNNGPINYNDVCLQLSKFDKDKITSHFSGIEYSEKGEKNHIPTDPEKAEKLIKALIKHKISIRIINESPIHIDDAVMMKKIYDNL